MRKVARMTPMDCSRTGLVRDIGVIFRIRDSDVLSDTVAGELTRGVGPLGRLFPTRF